MKVKIKVNFSDENAELNANVQNFSQTLIITPAMAAAMTDYVWSLEKIERLAN